VMHLTKNIIKIVARVVNSCYLLAERVRAANLLRILDSLGMSVLFVVTPILQPKLRLLFLSKVIKFLKEFCTSFRIYSVSVLAFFIH